MVLSVLSVSQTSDRVQLFTVVAESMATCDKRNWDQPSWRARNCIVPCTRAPPAFSLLRQKHESYLISIRVEQHSTLFFFYFSL